MRHRLMPMWVVLWTELGVRPTDVAGWQLDDALVIEVYADDARRRNEQAARERARAARRK